mgnify:CR=1 FL=1
MKPVILISASFACLLLAFSGCGSDAPSDSLVPVPTRDLIANGGFERPVLTDTLSSSLKPFATYATTSFAVPGWTVSGIDIVHGHSSHHLRRIEVYRGKLVLYGCGDFLDDYEGISRGVSLRRLRHIELEDVGAAWSRISKPGV